MRRRFSSGSGTEQVWQITSAHKTISTDSSTISPAPSFYSSSLFLLYSYAPPCSGKLKNKRFNKKMEHKVAKEKSVMKAVERRRGNGWWRMWVRRSGGKRRQGGEEGARKWVARQSAQEPGKLDPCYYKSTSAPQDCQPEAAIEAAGGDLEESG